MSDFAKFLYGFELWQIVLGYKPSPSFTANWSDVHYIAYINQAECEDFERMAHVRTIVVYHTIHYTVLP